MYFLKVYAGKLVFSPPKKDQAFVDVGSTFLYSPSGFQERELLIFDKEKLWDILQSSFVVH